MSLYWDIVCLECNDKHGFQVNHGDSTMVELVGDAVDLGIAAKSLVKLKSNVVLRVDHYGESLMLDMQWFARHGDHHLSPVDEYGRLKSECGLAVKCGTCDAHHSCKLDREHGGDCSMKKVKV